jgi:HPt (histidine-containing phosphotransfer) domain-containing protein
METITSPIYSVLGNHPDLKELVGLFVAEMPDRISHLLDRLDASDWEGVRRAVHQLKGSAGSYGFEPISRSAGQVEEAIRESRPEEHIRRSVEELVELCRRAQAGPSA